MDKNLDNFRKIHEEALKYSQVEGNETFRELNKTLIIFATAILSFSLFIFLNTDIVKTINFYEKIILVSIWLLLGLSILAGIKQFFEDYNFFKSHVNFNSAVVSKCINEDEVKRYKLELKIFEEDEEEMEKIDKTIIDHLVYAKIREEIAKKYPNILPESPEIFIKVQVALIIVPLFFLIFFMIKFLF